VSIVQIVRGAWINRISILTKKGNTTFIRQPAICFLLMFLFVCFYPTEFTVHVRNVFRQTLWTLVRSFYRNPVFVGIMQTLHTASPHNFTSKGREIDGRVIAIMLRKDVANHRYYYMSSIIWMHSGTRADFKYTNACGYIAGESRLGERWRRWIYEDSA
jgi:hypothetical protein